ncbi:MAG: hypothetical protein R3C14_31965 [Caldilineaceae bacterium]
MHTITSNQHTYAVDPRSAKRKLSSSVTVWLALMTYLALVKIIITFVPTTFRDVSQAQVFAWLALGIFALLSAIGLWLAARTGFPAAWDARLTNRQRLWWPILIGLAYGVLEVAFDLATGYSAYESAQHGGMRANIDFPASVLIYPGGAIIVEIAYRTLLIPLLLWLISTLALRGRGQEPTFWTLAVLTSLIEPLTQDMDAWPLGIVMFAAVIARGFGLNFIQVTLFRKNGWLAAILMRVAFYIVWHMLYVH